MERGKSSVLLLSAARQNALSEPLAARGHAVRRFGSVEQALSALDTQLYDAAFVELDGPEGLAGLRLLAERFPDLPLVACGPEDTELARAALEAGASELLVLPLVPEALELALAPVLARRQASLLESPHVRSRSGLLGTSPQMMAVRDRIQRVAVGTSTVLVRGETGTGKELVARALHAASARREAPFIRVHAAALPDALLESELFGYEKGAFTGANARKLGRVELAEGGTIFFDEIGELSAAMQVKLLRLIQEREYERLGGTRTLRADVRFVAATHRDLEHLVQDGKFREDLFYRLNVVTVWLPPLRARREDIALIADQYLRTFRAANGKPDLRFHDAALHFLLGQRWPGNVRQLVNFVERLVVLAQHDAIGLEDVQRHLDEQIQFLTQAAAVKAGAVEIATPSPTPASAAPSAPAHPAPAEPLNFSSAVRPLREDVRRAERRALLKALQYASGNRALAARMLGVSRRTLYTKLEEHGID